MTQPHGRGRSARAMARFAALALSGALIGLAADPASAQTLDLASVWRAALTQDATLGAAEAAALAGRERVPQAKAALRPNVALSASRFQTDRVTSGKDEQYGSGSASLSIRQALYRPQQYALVAQAEAEQAQSEARLERERQALFTRVAEAYFDVLLAGDQAGLIEAQAAYARTQLAAAEKAFRAGSGIRTDIDEALARVDLIAAQALEARQQQAAALQTLRTLVTEPFSQVATLNTDTFEAESTEPLSTWLANAEAFSPELKVLQAQRDAAVRALEVAAAGHRPTLDVVAQWQHSDRQQYNRSDDRYRSGQIGLQLNVPLYSGGAISSAVRQAAAEVTQAEQGLEAARRELGTRIAREWRGVTEGAARVRALGLAVRSSAQALQANQQSFQAGARTTLDVLQAQELYANAQRDQARARYVHLVSVVKLNALAGTADAALLQRINAYLRAPAPSSPRP